LFHLQEDVDQIVTITLIVLLILVILQLEDANMLMITKDVTTTILVPLTDVLLKDVSIPQKIALTTTHVPETSVIQLTETVSLLQLLANQVFVKSENAIL
jgi:hypothetical protein